MLTANTPAPEFSLLDHNSETQTLADYRGSWVLLYFYPKDDTPGCTKEACTIAEAYDVFQEESLVVMGVSKDSVASHKKFREKYNLPFILLADTEKEVIEAYGAAKRPFGTQRISYLINPEGAIAHVFPKVTPADHAGEVIEAVRGLRNAG